MQTLNPQPGEWYLLYTCRRCNVKQILFFDLSRGTAKLNADYWVTCDACGDRDSYNGKEIERYQHPLNGTGQDGDGDAMR